MQPYLERPKDPHDLHKADEHYRVLRRKDYAGNEHEIARLVCTRCGFAVLRESVRHSGTSGPSTLQPDARPNATALARVPFGLNSETLRPRSAS